MCNCVSRPHQLIFALCNVNCVRTNDSFWVLYYYYWNFFFFFTQFIWRSIYLIGSRLVFAWGWFPPLCGKIWYVPMVKCLLICSLRETLNPKCGFQERVTCHCLDFFLTLRGLYACSVRDMGPISAPVWSTNPNISPQGQSNPYFGLLLYINWRGKGVQGPLNFFIRGLYLRL